MQKRKSDDDQLSASADLSLPKKAKTFSITEFRSKLHGIDSLKAIREFIILAETKNEHHDVVLEYLEDGGSVQEFVSLLDITAQADMTNASPIFRAINVLLLKIQSDEAAIKFCDEARQGVKKLMTTFLPAIQNMISINIPKNRKIVFNLLTAIVTLDHSFGRDVLSWFYLSSQHLEQLLEPGPVRKALIMFLLAFFVEKKSMLFQPLLEKKGLISAIIPNLMYDHAHTVCVVLSVLKENLLQNKKITKTVKLNIFNTQVTQSLFNLYNWVGLKGVQTGWKKKRGGVEDNTEVKKLVTSTLSDFLKVLCSDKKYGIVFQDKSLGFKAPMNQLMFTALEMIPKPWEKPETFQLVVDILGNSPDLVKPYLSKMENSFQPRESTKWIESMKFVSEVYQTIDMVSILSDAKEVLNASQIFSVVKGLLLIPALMKNLASAISPDKSIIVRCQAISVISIIMKKLNDYVRWLRTNEGKQGNQIKSLSSTLAAVIPQPDEIRKIWRQDDDKISIHRILSRFILEVAQFDPILIEQPHKLCKSLTHNLMSRDGDVKITILQAVSILEPFYLSPESDLFVIALKTLLKLVCSEKEQKSSLHAVTRMLCSSGLWSSKAEEIDCWLSAWLTVPVEAQECIGNVFVEALQFLIKREGKTAEANVDTEINSDERLPSPVLQGVFEIVSTSTKPAKTDEKELRKFLSTVALNIGHLNGSSKYLINICKKYRKYLSYDVASYLTQKDLPLPDKVENDFRAWLLGEESEEVNVSDLNMFQKSSLFNILVFYLRQYLFEGKFEPNFGERCQKTISSFIDSVSPTNTSFSETSERAIAYNYGSPFIFYNKCVTILLGDSRLLKYFSIISKSNTVETYFTSWLCRAVTTFIKKPMNRILLQSWKQRLLMQLKHRIHKRKKIESDGLLSWIELFEPTTDEVVPLMRLLCDTSDTSELPRGWSTLYLFLIRSVGTRPIPQVITENLVQTLCAQCRSETADAIYSEALLCLLTNFPHSIEYITPKFIEEIIVKQNNGPYIVDVGELYLQVNKNISNLINFIQKNPTLSYSRTLLELFSRILHKNRPFEESSEINCFMEWLQDRHTNGKRSILDEQVKNIVSVLYPLVVDAVKRYVDGEDVDLVEHCAIIKDFLRHGDSEELEDLLQHLASSVDRFPPTLMTASLIAFDSKSKEKYLPKFLKKLCAKTTIDDSWKLHSKVIYDLSDRTHVPEAWKKFGRSSTFSKFSASILSNLSSQMNSSKIAILNTVVSNVWDERAECEELKKVFAQCTNHQQFFNIMLTTDSPVKDELTSLLSVLLNRCPSLMVPGQVPVFLAAYNASLSISDQNIFRVLMNYERHCTNLSKFEPLFWGEPAVNHYSVREALWNPASAKSVLELLNMEKVKVTIAHFPLDRRLYGEVVTSRGNVYDPAFLLHLFSNLFSPSAVSYCESFVVRGGLSLTLSALSSEDKAIRVAAATVLLRFYSHVQLLQRSKHKGVWLHIVDCVRFGIEDISTKPLPSIVTVFLARAILETADPLSPLFTLYKFLLAKPVFNLFVFPEFTPLFFSCDHQNRKHRLWILETLRDGIRQDIDLHLVINSAVLKILLCHFESSLSLSNEKIVILQIISRILEVPSASSVISQFGLLSWLRHICSEIYGDLTEPFIELLGNVVITLRRKKTSTTMINKKQKRLNTTIRALLKSQYSCGDLQRIVNQMVHIIGKN